MNRVLRTRLPERLEQLVIKMHRYHREHGRWPRGRDLQSCERGWRSLCAVHYWWQAGVDRGVVLDGEGRDRAYRLNYARLIIETWQGEMTAWERHTPDCRCAATGRLR